MQLGYTLFYVSDVAQAMDFYHRAFGLEKAFFHESGQYGEMNTGATKLGFVHHDTASGHNFSYEPVKANVKAPGFEIGFTTADVAMDFARAVKAGAEPISPPERKPWGQVVSYVRDLNGFLVEICGPVGPS